MTKEVKHRSVEKMELTFEEMNNLRKQQVLCDLDIKCEGKVFSVHKLVLVTSSKYFKTMLTENFSESQFKEITIKEIAPNAMELLIDYMYNSEIEISEDNVQDLLVASDFLLIFDINDACIKFMKEKATVENCLQFYFLAHNLLHILDNMSELADVLFTFILNNFIEIYNSSDFCECLFDQIKKIIQDDRLNVKEEKVYEAVTLWVKHDLEDRSKLFLELLQIIRLPLIPLDYIENNIEKEHLVTSNQKCKDLLYDTYKMHALGKFDGCSYKHRTTQGHVILQLSYDKRSSSNQYQSYDIRKNQLYPPFTIRRDIVQGYFEKCTIILSDGKIFSVFNKNFKGLHGCHPVNNEFSISIYDANLNKWDRFFLDNYFDNPEIMQTIQFNDRIYIITHGGIGYYDMTKKIWNNVTFRISGCSNYHFEIAIVSNLIYIIAENNLCFSYNPITDVGHSIRPMNSTRRRFTLCSLNNVLYVIGGERENGKVEKYDQQTDTWIRVVDMSTPKFSPGAFTMNGLMYVIGGVNDEVIEYYNPKTEKWTIVNKCILNHPSSGRINAFTLDIKFNIQSIHSLYSNYIL